MESPEDKQWVSTQPSITILNGAAGYDLTLARHPNTSSTLSPFPNLAKRPVLEHISRRHQPLPAPHDQPHPRMPRSAPPPSSPEGAIATSQHQHFQTQPETSCRASETPSPPLKPAYPPRAHPPKSQPPPPAVGGQARFSPVSTATNHITPST